MILSVVIPVYNERDTIREILARVRAVPIAKEIICVDDCSGDGTTEILLEESSAPDIVFLRHQRNMGKGAAVRTGLAAVKGEIVIIQDADLEYDPSDYPRLLEPILRGETQVVYGSRFRGRRDEMSLSHNLGNRLVTWVTNILFGTALTDMETCYKVFTSEVAKRIELTSPRWAFDPEITAKVLRMGYTIREVPISYMGRLSTQGKKIRWQDGFTVLYTLVKCRFL